MDEYIGMIKIFAGSYPPYGWAFCNGAQLQVRQYTALFSIIGNRYGGDGQTTFSLPNLAGTTLIGAGTSATSGTNYDLGEQGGAETGNISILSMPPHNHGFTGTVQVMANADTAETGDPTGAFFGPTQTAMYSTSPSASMKPLASTLALGISGNGTAYDKRMAFTTVNYIICLEGIFPPRN